MARLSEEEKRELLSVGPLLTADLAKVKKQAKYPFHKPDGTVDYAALTSFLNQMNVLLGHPPQGVPPHQRGSVSPLIAIPLSRLDLFELRLSLPLSPCESLVRNSGQSRLIIPRHCSLYSTMVPVSGSAGIQSGESSIATSGGRSPTSPVIARKSMVPAIDVPSPPSGPNGGGAPASAGL